MREIVLPVLFAGGISTGLVWADVPSLPDITAFGGLGGTAILGWFAWHCLTKTIPNMLETAKQEMAATRQQHRSDLEAAREQHEEEKKALLQVLGQERHESRTYQDKAWESLDRMRGTFERTIGLVDAHRFREQELEKKTDQKPKDKP